MNEVATRGREILQSIDPVIREVYKKHLDKQDLWMPTELLPPDFKVETLPPTVTAMLVLNLLTGHLGSEHAIFDWTKLWTAEEFRHGQALQIVLDQVLNREQKVLVERMQYQYLTHGFWPDWGLDPIKLLAYVVIQEQATKVSHLGIALAAKDHSSVVHGLMKRVAAEEAKHHMAYLAIFKAVLLADPNHALQSLHSVIRRFAMPGNGIKNFSVLSEIQARLNVFGPAQFALIVDEVVAKLGLVNLLGLNAAGEKAREAIFASATTLRRLADRRRNPEVFVLPGFGEEFVFTL